MKYYVVRHKATGRLMPARMFRTNTRGWSTWEPSDKPGYGYGGYGTVPRLFDSEIAARRAIIAWAEGPWFAPKESEGSWEEGYYEYLGTPVPKGDKKGRSRDELEVLSAELTLP